ncbi:hypothetical protein [Rudaea sp.]|uniref:hypothetical protein n=1 Tax=Rudaea sp. TaxID=2136325 RepID=UPI002ED3CB6D
MTRLSKTQHDLRVFAAMAVYVVLLLILLPHARRAEDSLLRLVYALLPVLPLLYVVWLLGRRIWQADELEQRTHLIGLGVASAVVGVFSLIGGFLAITKALPQEAPALLLIWVFPILLFSYGLVREWAARHYGGGLCDEADGMPAHVRLLIVALIFGAVGAWSYFHSTDNFAFGVFCGIATAFFGAAVVFGLRRWLRPGNHAGDR